MGRSAKNYSQSKGQAEKASKRETTFLDACQVKITFQCIYDMTNAIGFPDKERVEYVKAVLPKALVEIIGNNKSACNRLFYCDDNSGIGRRFVRVRDRLLDTGKNYGGPYTFDNSPIRQEAIQKWDELLNEAQVDRKALSESIRNMVNAQIRTEPKDGPQIKKRIQKLLNEKNLSEALATLTLIASTLFCWNHLPNVGKIEKCQNEKENKLLYDLVLSPSASDLATLYIDKAVCEIESAERFTMDNHAFGYLQTAIDKGDKSTHGRAYYYLAKAWELCGDEKAARRNMEQSAKAGYELAKRTLSIDQANETAMQRLSSADKMFSVGKLQGCYQNCKNILGMSPAPTNLEVLGRAAWLAYLCVKEKPNKGESAMQYLAISRDFGNEKAASEWTDKTTVVPQLKQSRKQDNGIYLCNSNNQLGVWIRQTAPVGWKQVIVDSGQNCLNATEDGSRGHLKCFFVDDDETKNRRDLLYVLQRIQQDEGICGDEVEIFLRGNSESLRLMIDTSTSHMKGRIPRIYVIDDNLWPVQWLLSKHPLFYPIRALPANSETTLHLIAAGNTKRIEWLVREAFALLGFENEKIQCRISVVAPDADRVQNDLFQCCPGFLKEVAGIPMPTLSFERCGESFYSEELNAKLLEFYQEPNSNCYFVVDTGDETENLDLSVKLRELLIRSVVLTSKKISSREKERRLNSQPPIAFFCEDPGIAHLSKSMVYDFENFGNRWFNSPCLIPFGTMTDRYTWDNAAGGILEDFAQTIHLQYHYSARVTEKLSEKVANTDVKRENVNIMPEEQGKLEKDGMAEYFRRMYNHDSSLAMAASIPYRLFQFGLKKQSESEQQNMERFVPSCWRIVDSDAYCSEWLRNTLKQRLQEYHSTLSLEQWDNQVTRVAKWEHDRWARWMLSRGWLPESIDEAINCFKFGNKRQQLYIARLHPCICAYDQLSVLSQVLKDQCKMNKDFTSLDKDSVINTENILSLQWGKGYYVKEVER